jgi:hypothetical protein
MFPLALLLNFSCANQPYGKDAESIAHSELPEEANTMPAQPEPMEAGQYEVILAPGDDLPAIFRALTAAGQVQRIVFSPGNYTVDDTLHLPRTRSLVVIDGQGARLKATGSFPVFYSLPANQEEAMVYNKTRYLIRDFGMIEGGDKGIFLGSSFNTVIQNIEFIGQRTAAIDLVFCLMCSLEHLLVTNPFHDGIVLRSGLNSDTRVNAWPGTSYNNSQCNHTVLRSCRVYNRKGTAGTSFKVLQSTGVRLVDCISEGWTNARAVFFDADRCSTAKFFAIENFHLEHAPSEGGLVFRSMGSTVEVDGLFTQIASAESPTIWLMNNGNYVFKNIPWWPKGAWVNSSHSPAVVIQHCTNRFYDFNMVWRNGERPGQPIFREYFRTSADLVR